MAEYVYGSGVPYGQYLQENAYIRDITGQIKKNGEATQHKITSQTREIVASNERLSQEFGTGFNAVNGTLEIGFNRVESALCDVEASIESLHSDFNYNMGLVLDQLQIQNQLTFGILEKLDAIHKTLETPRLTQARECYNIGCERLSKGLLDKALEAFLKAEERNDTDFFIQFQIGKLYLYGVDEDDNVIDLEKAEQHLRNAIRYGKAEVSALPEFKRWAGEALLHASIACYVQANDQLIYENTAKAKEFISEAFKLAQQACEIYPSLSESHYHLAKYSALLGDTEISIKSLEKVVCADVNYCLKIEFDRDFDNIRLQVFDLFEQLLVKMWEKTRQRMQEYKQKYLADMVYLSDEAKNTNKEINQLLSIAETKINNNTIFDFDEASAKLDQIRFIYSDNRYKFSNQYSTNGIESYAINSDGSLIAVIRDNYTRKYTRSELELCQAFDGEILNKISFDGSRGVISFNQDDKLIALLEAWITSSHSSGGSKSKTEITINRVSDLKTVQTIKFNSFYGGSNSISFSPDWKFIAIKSKSHEIEVWRVSDGKLDYRISGDEFLFSPDGKIIATSDIFDTKTVKLWQVKDGELINTISAFNFKTFSPDGKIIVTINVDPSTLELWTVKEGERLHKISGHPANTFFSSDGKFFGTWNLNDEKTEIRQLSDWKLLHTSSFPAFQLSPDGKLICVWNDNNKEIRQLSDGKLIYIFPDSGHTGRFSSDWNFFFNYNRYSDKILTVFVRQIISKKEFDQQKSLTMKKIEIKKKDDEYQNITEQEILTSAQEYNRKVEGVCLVCGNKLSFFDKLRGKTTCSKHSS